MTVNKEYKDGVYKLVVSELEPGFASAYAKVIITAISNFSESYKPIAMMLENGLYTSPFSLCNDLAEDASSIMLAVAQVKYDVDVRSGADIPYIIIEGKTNSKGILNANMLSVSTEDYTVKVDSDLRLATAMPGTSFNLKVILAKSIGFNSEIDNKRWMSDRDVKLKSMVDKCITISSIHTNINVVKFEIQDEGWTEKLTIHLACDRADSAEYIPEVVKRFQSNLKKFVSQL